MLHALRDQPQRRAEVLAEAGIDSRLLDNSHARVPASAFAALWLIQIRNLHDEFFRLDSHGMPPGSFALICRGLIQEPTLGKAMRQCLGNFGLFLRDIRGSLSVRGTRALITLAYSGDTERRGYAEETFAVLMVSLLCWLGGRRISLDRVDFHHRRPALEDDPLLWGPNLNFGAAQTEIEFAASVLALPMVQDLAGLKQFLRTAPQWLMIRYRNPQGLVAQVHRRLRGSQYGEWPTLVSMAQACGLSATRLRRQLEREGCSYQQLKDEVRRGMACECLRSAGLSVADVAQRTGFQETSAFHRAFKKWTGESPGAYRARHV
ncbi:AraC family transcriptional regulator ligand-binding domain-containing protein [Pseudomonas sp. TE3610]